MNILASMVMKLVYMFLKVSQGANAFPPPLGAEAEREYFRAARRGDRDARCKLIEHNLRLVSHIVKKYYTQSRNQDDLTSVGTIGLIKAVDSFDCENGARFATYASKCIQNEILMYFRSRKKLSQEVSMDEPIDTDKDGNPLTYMDVIAVEDTVAEDLDLKISGEMAARIIRTALTAREREIIVMRYGLSDLPPMTQRELAARLGISRSYVSRIEKAALEKIRSRMGGRRP